MKENIKFAELDVQKMEKLKELEKKTGSCIVALEPQYPFMKLSEEELLEIKEMEKELGLTLLAYQPK